MIRNSRRVIVLAVAGAVAIAPVISGCGAGTTPQSAAPTQLTQGVNVSIPTGKASAAQIDLRHMFLLGADPGKPVPAGTSMALYGVMINQVEDRKDRLVSVSSPVFGGEAKIDGGGIVLPGAAPDGTGSLVKLVGTPSETPSPKPSAGKTSPAKKKTQQPGGTASGGATPEPTGPGATPNVSGSPTSGNTMNPQESGLPAAPGGDQPLVVLTGLTKELLAGATVPLTMRFERAGSVQFQIPVVPRQGAYLTYPLPDSPAPTPQTPGGQTPGIQTPGIQTPGTQTPGSPTPGGTASPSPSARGEAGSPTGTATPAPGA